MSGNPGLRRRSPNPNSPIPYSPALLSPYLNPTTHLGLGYTDLLKDTSDLIRMQTHRRRTTPTRLYA